MQQRPDEPQRFRAWIARRLGLRFDDTKLEFLAEVLSRQAEKKGLAASVYLNWLQSAHGESELQGLAFELTVPETYFFRHMDQFRAFAEVALPQARGLRGPSCTTRILSAGCATGEEPYTLAMLARERGTDFSRDVDIRALDINPAVLAKAAKGVYSLWALRETPADSQKRWFKAVGKGFELDATIRSAVTFHAANLAEESGEFWAPHQYDVIFCRNVLMYFTEDAAQDLVKRLTRSLVPGGHLFLGHAETLRGLSDEYHLCHTHGTFYYRRKPVLNGKSSTVGDQKNSDSGGLAEPVFSEAPMMAVDSQAESPATWLQTIEQASERIRALTERPTAAAALRDRPVASDVAERPPPLHVVLELLKEERFADALELLGGLTTNCAQDPDVLLLRAALLTHSGQLAAAERVGAQLLVCDELNAGAHYLLALCRESAGDRSGALEHDRTAIYLDSNFAMPRLHLGLMARRAGDWEGARRELTQALPLLKREDASRLLLFGGGFGREALIALCHAELKSAGTLA
jgi:chemotaxis protein methyltransferase CheR